ncbi:LysR family transcriptional regulator [uncultured Peptoniphilus sp.]|uniref:LysR substrate-binding domain-containing protein n=1 Tax=uncultured Peptoniphilus sp. TaxID=254354 RepID=UPI002805E846|nr:LysR family transcriptional regulator [uncultured Peptoniphilus sp.]
MTIRDLEIFCEVVRTKNMSLAAKNLSISQPTVSHAISQIEKEYSVELFKRISKKLYITDVGIRLYHNALQLIEKFEDIILFLKISSNNYDLNLAFSTSFTGNFLMDMIWEFENIHKDLEVKTSVLENDRLIEYTQMGYIDAGIIEGDLPEDLKRKLDYISFYRDREGLIVAKNHILANKKEISIKDLEDENFVTQNFPDEDKENFICLLKDRGFNLKIKYICSNKDMVLNILKAGKAITIGSLYEFNCPDLSLIKIKEMGKEKDYKIIFRKGHEKEANIKSFIDFLERKYNKE